MTAILSCVNLKGGVGKTALAVNFAAYCGRKGLSTLLVDLDPQTNATFSCIQIDDWEKHAADHGTVANLLGARNYASAEGKKKTAEEVVVENVFNNVDLIPSHLDLFTVDLDLAGATARETKLEKALRSIRDNYEIIVCDCPPNLTIPTQNALAMSTHYVVPISPDYLSAIGVALLLNRVQELSTELENDLEHIGIVMSRVGRPAKSRTKMKNSLRETFKTLVLKTELTERVAVANSAAKNIPIFDTSDDEAIGEFRRVCGTLLKRMGVKI